ncbi:DUF6515 family protein [Maribacter ulvicola]|uniref:Uncharacterized protein n=1 Tax=Maribacter ulvicola TaxID=228959 RepID=A0A1N6UHI0_9FLAO|nr:DUF6515 family protein [Maribacter ulvicola]SIQ65064.1 hypothetical protein SAMN05421797_102343 [Maribacter ulvicola]
MKSNTKTYTVLGLLLVALAIPSTAQTRKRTVTKMTTTRTTTVAKTPGRVSSKKVQYRTPTKKIVSVRTVPNSAVIKHNGQNYYYSNNRYYTASRGRYISIAPKVGFRIHRLPQNYVRINFNNHLYFNVDGIFYVASNAGYEVVEPEIGTIVYELPDGYEKVIVDNLTYYEYSNILYEKVQVDGSRAYVVVGIVDME